MSEVMLFYVPVPSREVGAMLGLGAVEMQLAASANLLGRMQTFFERDGVVHNHIEWPLLLKTLPDLADDLKQWLVESHPYDCPCILRLPPVEANDEFSAWVSSQLIARTGPEVMFKA